MAGSLTSQRSGPISCSDVWRRRRESNPCTRFCRPLPEPLGHVATGLVLLAAPRGFEPRLTDPKSAVLPLDDGAPLGAHASRSGSADTSQDMKMERKTGLEPATLTLAR